MSTNKLTHESISTVPNSTRCLAIFAGCVSGLAGFLTIGIVLLFVPVLLILGALIQPSAPRLGRWLLAIGAMLVSVSVGLFFVPAAVKGISSVSSYHDAGAVAIVASFVISIVLVGWTDVALVINERKKRPPRPVAHSIGGGD